MNQKSEMDSIVQKSHEGLLEIEGKLSKCNVPAFKNSNWKNKALRAWSRINWDPEEVNGLRSRVTSCISLANLVMEKINQYEDLLFISEFDETNITDIEEISSVFSGLVVVEGNSNIAKLVNFTAEKYLKLNWTSWLANVHEHLTDTCLTYLSFDVFDGSRLSQDSP